jgi:hypothetical protein
VQCLRHRQYALLNGEAFSAAWLMLFPLAGAAIDDDGATVSPTPMARRITKAIFFIVVSSTKSSGRLTRDLASDERSEYGLAQSQSCDTEAKNSVRAASRRNVE